jgi:two-component system invasion response regulator UvrY
MPDKIKLVIADDHLLIAETWATIINLEHNFNVLKVYDYTQTFMDELLEVKLDIIIMDVNIAPLSGIEATKEILKKLPT